MTQVEDKQLPIYAVNIMRADTRSQGISNHDTDLLKPG